MENGAKLERYFLVTVTYNGGSTILCPRKGKSCLLLAQSQEVCNRNPWPHGLPYPVMEKEFKS